MFAELDWKKQLKKEEYKARMNPLMEQMSVLQRECYKLDIPVLIIFEGYDASGKGIQISHLIRALDPRGFRVYTIEKETQKEKGYPFLKRFWEKIPEKGRIAIFDTSWYRKAMQEKGEKEEQIYESIRVFERQLTDDGMIVIKFFLAIDKKEQKKRFQKLMASEDTAWKVTKKDRKRHKHFADYTRRYETMIRQTNTNYAPWVVVEAVDMRYATVKIYETILERLEEKISIINHKQVQQKGYEEDSKHFILKEIDLNQRLDRTEYKKRLKGLQKRLEKAQGKLYTKGIPVVIGLEGWDAAGKGGAIKRLTESMDPRGYDVYPISAPDEKEKRYHYLWRFWSKMPAKGQIAIFDRTWYGRILVEQVEGFCTPEEYKRAFQEIREMEEELIQEGAIVLKFWIHIDKEEQEKRFMQRMNDPMKQWKITEEDWRNREKWDLYESAVDRMIEKTNWEYAPWFIIEGNDKYYARIKVLETVVKALEDCE